MTEGLNNDIWIEVDGKKIGMFDIVIQEPYYGMDNSGLQGSGGLFYIKQLCKIERAMVQPVGSPDSNATGWSGGYHSFRIAGISGNQVTVNHSWSGATMIVSGCSGSTLRFLVMGQ